MNARVKAMEWGINPRLMCVVTDQGVSACRKMLLNYRFRDNYVVIQVCVCVCVCVCVSFVTPLETNIIDLWVSPFDSRGLGDHACCCL